MAHGARNQSLAARVVDRVSEVNTKLRSSLRVVAATGMAAMMMLGGSAALAASSGALPGDALYAVKQWKESAQLVVVDGDEEGVRLLSFAGERLDEIEGLDERGVSDQRLYTGTLEEMDALTNQAAEIIIGGFRTRGGKEPNAMLDLAGFAKTQRLHLTRLMDRLPPAVRPAVLDSIAVAEAVQERTETVLENPACPCDANPLAPSTDESASDEPVSCECEPAAAAPTEPQPASRPEDDSDPEPDPDDDRDDDSGGKDDDEDEDTDVDVPDVDGTDADDEAEEVINDLIDDLGLPIPEPSSAPVDPTALLP